MGLAAQMPPGVLAELPTLTLGRWLWDPIRGKPKKRFENLPSITSIQYPSLLADRLICPDFSWNPTMIAAFERRNVETPTPTVVGSSPPICQNDTCLVYSQGMGVGKSH